MLFSSRNEETVVKKSGDLCATRQLWLVHHPTMASCWKPFRLTVNPRLTFLEDTVPAAKVFTVSFNPLRVTQCYYLGSVSLASIFLKAPCLTQVSVHKLLTSEIWVTF